MEIKTNGKRNIILPDVSNKKKIVLKDINGDIVSYIKTGKNGGRITGIVPDVVFAELEDVTLRPVNMGVLNIAKTLDLTDEMNLVLEKQNAIRQAFSAVLDFKAEIEDKFIKNKEQTDIALSELAEVARNTGIINDERYEEIKAVDLSQSVDIEKIYGLCSDLALRAGVVESEIESITTILNGHEHEKQTKESLDLGNVDNTSDIDKPVSKAVQDALDEKVSKEELTEFAEYIEKLKKRQGEIEDGIQSLGGICANPIPIGGKVGDVLTKRSDLDGDFWWSKPASSENATEEKAGIAKIATQEDATAGVDNTKIMTPLKVATVLENESTKLKAQIDANADAILKTRNDLQEEIDENVGDITALQAETTTIRSDLDDLGDQVSGIEEKIPDTATSSNQLADKNFVNSSIATETATFKGTFNTLEELKAVSADNNDYGFVISKDTAGNTIYNRYKYNGSEWVFEYALNNSSFTASQWASINSGATQTNISQITTNKNDIDDLGEQVSGIEEKIPSNASVSNQLTTKSYVDAREQAVRADYAQADSELQTQINGQATAITEAQGDIVDLQNNKQGVISDLDTIRSGAGKGATSVQPSDLSNVATSGSYDDLTNKPTIPSSTSQLTNDSDYTTKEYVDTTEQEIIENFMEADTSLQTQITGQATVLAELQDDVMANMTEIADLKISKQDKLTAGENITIENNVISSTGGGSGSNSGRNVGDIFYTTRTDTALKGAVECNGGTYSTGDFTGSESIGNLLSDGKVPYVSLDEYARLISTNGSCRAFGWEGGDSFRVPTLNDVYIEAGTALADGEFINESLPNITGQSNGFESESSIGSSSGAIKTIATSSGWSGGSTHPYKYIQFNASWSNPTYQDGAKVKPDSVRYRAMVQLANEATDEALITATSVVQDVADLKDASNFTATGKETVAGLGTPSRKNITLTSGSSGTTYTAPANGYFFARVKSTTANSGWATLKNNKSGIVSGLDISRAGANFYGCVRALKDDTVTLQYGSATVEVVMFIYTEGGQ